MDERLRMMFREEMSAERQPPLGDLLGDAVRDGRRARRTRRAWIGVGSTGVVAAVAVGAFLVVPGKGPQREVAPLKGPVPVLAASSTSTVIKQPSGPKSPVTDAAVVEQLARLLPAGRTSGFAQGSKEANRYAFGQIYLDAGKGPGMVRAFVYKGGLSDKACSTTPNTEGLASKEAAELKASTNKKVQEQVRQRYAALMAQKRPGCMDLPGGGRALFQKDADGTASATVDHGSGIVVNVFTTTWLAWNGKENPAGTVALTPDQVLKIAAFPGWGAKMDSALVRKAAADHPSMPTVY
jgi:hypothetical protein